MYKSLSYSRPRAAKTRPLVILAIVAAGLLLGVWWWAKRPAPGPDPAAPSPRQAYQTAVAAVAASEEADFRHAIELWSSLIAQQPQQQVLKLNQAVTILKWIDEVNAQLGSGRGTPAEIAALNQELDDAYQLVEDTVALLQQENIDDYRATYVAAALLEKRSLRSQADEIALRKQAADLLANHLEKLPGQPLLACKFDELAAELEAEYPELQQQNADFLSAAFEAAPRNMYILKRAAETLMGNQDPRLASLLEPSVELARPMMDAPAVARLVERLQPDTLIKEVAASITAGDWADVRKLQRWLNTLVGMSGFKSDGRLAKPDVLALLDTSFLRDMATRVEPEIAPIQNDVPMFIFEELPVPASAALWYDFDFDLDFDVVVASGRQLLFYQFDAGDLSQEPQHVVELDFAPTGMLAVDLFEVDLPTRPRWAGSVAELMNAEPPPQELPAEQIAAARRHDTLQELLVWDASGARVVSLNSEQAFQLLDVATGLEAIPAIQQIVPADFESDGDLDLAILTSDGLVLMQNNGNRTFENIDRFSTLPEQCQGLVACDFDQDTDQDLLILNPQSTQASWLENILHSQFRLAHFSDTAWQLAASAAAIEFADVDGNGSWDWISVGPEQTRVTTTRRLDDHSVAARDSQAWPFGGQLVSVVDLNNDGTLELICGSQAGLFVQLGMLDAAGERRLADEQTELGLQGQQITQLSVRDCNGDGASEILAIADGRVAIGRVNMSAEGNFVLARVVGINDVNGGGRVNHYAVGSTLEIWADGDFYAQTIRDPVTHFGLGHRDPQNLRIVFPNGLTQNVSNPPTNTLLEEKQVLRGSCPFAYGWNGERFELITDLLWNAPLGLQIAKGQVLPDRRWENLLLPAHLMQPRAGNYELRITEELWEVAYFDQVQLTAVDHPPHVRVFTNEKVGPAALAEHRLFAVEQSIYPQRAIDSHGRDCLPALLQHDQQYVQAFDHQICQGLCEPHFIELDFGQLPTDQQLRLFLTGWMYPTDTSLNIGIDQNPDRSPPEPPSLWVVNSAGDWVCAQAFMGFPGGKPKSIVVDLQDVFLCEDQRLRIAASQQIYWDEAFVSWHAGDDRLQTQPVSLESAELRYRGFSELLPRAVDQPHWYDYQSVAAGPNWPVLDGPFTRFGEVADRLRGDDDRLVVMASGDEMALRFALPEHPLPAGWTRDFVLHSTGWDKDADLNTLAGQGSLPLPFMAQTSYPPPPEQQVEAEAVWRKNADSLTRHLPSPTARHLQQRRQFTATPPAVAQ